MIIQIPSTIENQRTCKKYKNLLKTIVPSILILILLQTKQIFTQKITFQKTIYFLILLSKIQLKIEQLKNLLTLHEKKEIRVLKSSFLQVLVIQTIFLEFHNQQYSKQTLHLVSYFLQSS
ncbi:transmembrane protein, putative (macronuclear) [Tetrahymena thermophila SB210]|uniref:Transmembrane protein, putative n=1 Tax=Tetrahymena thermophila (strain SB210) TaxID=312017 RepID=W7XDF9_TETTS|nr:transmembrane protein, putative [Tetrahymena thermophila SB210]EWS71851.1 transmembrane protein, putative [Tetrahymena thermophila SB210]|eukprot:XP_012655595.1 transmembrane protein, putative [Tetrahymena thermophila SB210]